MPSGGMSGDPGGGGGDGGGGDGGGAGGGDGGGGEGAETTASCVVIAVEDKETGVPKDDETEATNAELRT